MNRTPLVERVFLDADVAVGQVAVRVQQDVVVQVRPVGVRGDHAIVLAAERLTDKPHAQLVRLFGCDGIGGVETLDHMMRQHPTLAFSSARPVEVAQVRAGDGVRVVHRLAGRRAHRLVTIGLHRVGVVLDGFRQRRLHLRDLHYRHDSPAPDTAPVWC